MHFIECLAVRELVTTPFHGLRWCSPHARVPVLNQSVSNPRRCCCRIWSPPTLERRADCGGLGGGACVVWRWCMWVWVRWWRWWKSGCVWRRGACEMVWPCVHRYGMCVVWEVWVRWCGRMCMGVGEMRKRVMAVCAWCVWVWESGESGKVVDGRRKKWVSYWWFNAWVLRVFWEKKWKKKPSLVWCLTNFITYFKYKF